jgi:hypothetical protein
MSVYKASKIFNVPESTLRDRTRNKVSVDCSRGAARLFTEEEEKSLVDYLVYMSTIGYCYCITEIQDIAAIYARSIGKSVRAKAGLSQGWVYSFIKRWDVLDFVNVQKRAKCASEETLRSYFSELQSVLIENDLMNSPERIYYIGECEISAEYKPCEIAYAEVTKSKSVNSKKSKTVTVIGSANANGNYIPPFYIFPGKRWFGNLLDGAAPDADGDMSESGFVRGLFEDYTTGHFAKHTKLCNESERPKILVLYDGHKLHLSLTLSNWAKEHNVILFVLPHHCSHLDQPLHEIFDSMKTYYFKECKTYVHKNPGVDVTRYDVAKLTTKPYAKAFTHNNICSAFEKEGIYPFSADVAQCGNVASEIDSSDTEQTETVST